MNEEKYIEERMAKHNPFKVPEGYFDSFAEHVMELLPEEKPKAKRMVIRAWMYAAACLLVILFSATVYFSIRIMTRKRLLPLPFPTNILTRQLTMR